MLAGVAVEVGNVLHVSESLKKFYREGIVEEDVERVNISS